MKKTRLILAIAVIVLIFGGILVSDALGFWQTSGSKVPKKFESGLFEGEYDPWDIRGSYTFGNIEDAFDIDASLLAKAFGVKTDNPEDVQVKTLEALYENAGFPFEIGTGSVRYFVALYKGLPLTDSEGLTTIAVNILREQEKITEEQYQELITSAININAEYQTPTDGENEPEEHGSETSVTGSTTVGQALDMGIPEDVLAEYVGSTSNHDALVRDLVKEKGLSFGEIRTTLNEYLESN